MPIPTVEEKLRFLKPEPATAYEQACMAQLRPGHYEIGVQETNDIVDEGMQVFERCCRTSFGVTGDSIVGIFTAAGDLANAACGTYLHAIIPPIVIKYILAHHRENPGVRDGDIWYTNDALYGGIHNPDQVALMPVFYEGELVAWTAALTHTTETGAIEPGGMPPSARSRFEEGMNLPPLKVAENFVLREDILEVFVAFGMRAPQMVHTDLRARCTTADRARVRLVEMCKKHGADFLVGLLRQLVADAEEGARRKIRAWPDGKYRCVSFVDAVGVEASISRAYLTLIKEGERLIFDFTGTSPETPTSFNAHPQAAVGHVAQYVYEYLFTDLPISSATFAPVDFRFPEGSFLAPSPWAATSNVIQIASNLIGISFNCFGKMLFSSETDWVQVAAPKAVSGNSHFLAGTSQWGLPFSDIMAFQLNTRGQGARARMDGMNAANFLFCSTARSPDVEWSENEFPVLIPLSSHWRDSCGHGKYRGGVGTAQVVVAHGSPEVKFLCASPNSRIQNGQPLFGGYMPPTTPGVTIRDADILDRMRSGDKDFNLDVLEILEDQTIGGEWDVRFRVQPPRSFNEGEVLNIAFTIGGAGYGDPLDRDADLVIKDMQDRVLSEWAAREIYAVVWDAESGKVDQAGTEALRQAQRQARLARGRPYREFLAEWEQLRPPAEALAYYGSWPDARPNREVVRP